MRGLEVHLHLFDPELFPCIPIAAVMLFVALSLLLFSSCLPQCSSLDRSFDFRRLRTFLRDGRMRTIKEPSYRYEIDVAAACIKKLSKCSEMREDRKQSKIRILNDGLPLCSKAFNYSFNSVTASLYAVNALERCRGMPTKSL